MRLISATLVFFIFIFILTGCQTAKELHYFKEGENYYRLRINEKSFASKSRYLAGFFDEHAVDKYFSEVGQPDSARVVEWLAKPGEKAKLVMILSTNSNSVSEQIGSFANNEELLEMVARLSNKDKIVQIGMTDTEIQSLKLVSKNILNACAAYFEKPTPENIQNNIRDFLENLKATSKGKLQLESLNGAIIRYQKN